MATISALLSTVFLTRISRQLRPGLTRPRQAQEKINIASHTSPPHFTSRNTAHELLTDSSRPPLVSRRDPAAVRHWCLAATQQPSATGVSPPHSSRPPLVSLARSSLWSGRRRQARWSRRWHLLLLGMSLLLLGMSLLLLLRVHLLLLLLMGMPLLQLQRLRLLGMSLL